jgi:hypothetical protein
MVKSRSAGSMKLAGKFKSNPLSGSDKNSDKKATPKKNKDYWRVNEKEEFVNLLYLALEGDDNFQFISLSLTEIVNKCQLQGMMRSYGPHALFNLTQNQNGIKILSESLASGGFQPHDEVMRFLYDHIHVAVREVLRSREVLQSQTLEVIDSDSEDDGDNPQEDEIQNKIGESGEPLSAFDQNLATLTQAWQVKSTADKEKLRAQYELAKQS